MSKETKPLRKTAAKRKKPDDTVIVLRSFSERIENAAIEVRELREYLKNDQDEEDRGSYGED